MTKFTPINLERHLNTDRSPHRWHRDVGQYLSQLPAGQQTFWGIPFDLGPLQGNSWLVLDNTHPNAIIPINGTAPYLIFAHFCDESHDPRGIAQPIDYDLGFVTRPGEHLADYILVYSDQVEHKQAMRRRFEIGELITLWGQAAFAARPHVKDASRSWRDAAPPGEWGVQQTGMPRCVEDAPIGLYWLYALANPYPDKTLVAVRLETTRAAPLVVAGLTLYHGQEHPLRHRRLESFRVTLEQPLAPSALGADIDLGVIARQYTVPDFVPAQWLEDEPKGWGEQAPSSPMNGVNFDSSNIATTQHLLDLAASADATLRVAGQGIELREVYASGASTSKDANVRVEILTPDKVWVHVTVQDEGTRRPIPARIHFRAPDGRYLPPYGHRHDVNTNWFEDYGGDLKLGSTEYAYVDGRFPIELPTGEVYVEVAKGFEYQPIRQKLVVEPSTRELQLSLNRPLNWRKEGWVTADTHVHFLSPETAWLEAQAEGVNLVNLLASQWGELFTNVADISGGASGVSRDDTIIWVGTENRQHILGHISLLGVKGQPVFPMCAGGPDESFIGDPTWMSLAEWSDRAREREGVVVMPHFPVPYCEVAADIVLGKVDAAELHSFAPALENYSVREWYRFLNCGYRVAAVGGTDKMLASTPVGGLRTYADIGAEEFTFANWAKSVRAGRTFSTSGPLIKLSVEGHEPGDEIRLPAGGGTCEVEAWVASVQPFHQVQLVVNGQIVASERREGGTMETRLRHKLALNQSAWIAARCVSRFKAWHSGPVNIAAHTSPVYVRCGSDEIFSESDATYLLTLIDGGLTWLNTLSIPASASQDKRIREIFESAKRILNQRRFKEHSHDLG